MKIVTLSVTPFGLPAREIKCLAERAPAVLELAEEARDSTLPRPQPARSLEDANRYYRELDAHHASISALYKSDAYRKYQRALWALCALPVARGVTVCYHGRREWSCNHVAAPEYRLSEHTSLAKAKAAAARWGTLMGHATYQGAMIEIAQANHAEVQAIRAI